MLMIAGALLLGMLKRASWAARLSNRRRCVVGRDETVTVVGCLVVDAKREKGESPADTTNPAGVEASACGAMRNGA